MAIATPVRRVSQLQFEKQKQSTISDYAVFCKVYWSAILLTEA